MPNSFFKFKQFTISQANTAMKVGTDGVLLGAWAGVKGAERILDIGTGTGLIALMLAQKSTAKIDAIEINCQAAREAKRNFENSPWSDRICIFNESFQEFQIRYHDKYDLIVCNPPYFTDSKKAPDSSRSLARHDDMLPADELIEGVTSLLSENGTFSVILPFTGIEKFIQIAAGFKLFPEEALRIRPVPAKSVSRILIEFGKRECHLQVLEITIENGKRHHYSNEYIELTRDFYLNF